MTIELKPLGNACNLACTYCYQEPMRLAGNTRTVSKYDLDLMLDIADEWNKKNKSSLNYTVFGGEALLLPKKDLEKIFKRSFEKYGSAGVQTNGYLIDDEHIELFKKYNVSVGVSLDGPNELNNSRKPMSKKITAEESTNKIIENILKLRNHNINCGMIITLHKDNSETKENRDRLKNFILWLRDIGMPGGIIHMLETDSQKTKDTLELSAEQNIEAHLDFAEFFMEHPELEYDPFSIMKNRLEGKQEGGCVWNGCDNYNTQSVYGIEGNGQISNCGMVNKEGIEWTKSDSFDQTRTKLLKATPHEHGGCQGCEFFDACQGYCPGSAIDGDWRNKTVHCKTIKSLFNFYKKVM